MKVESGKLDRQLELLAPATVADEYGQEIDTFVKVTTIYAQRLEMRTQDAARAGARDTFTMARFQIRWRENITTGMRIRTDGKLYDIVAIDEPPPRRTSMVLMVEEATK